MHQKVVQNVFVRNKLCVRNRVKTVRVAYKLLEANSLGCQTPFKLSKMWCIAITHKKNKSQHFTSSMSNLISTL